MDDKHYGRRAVMRPVSWFEEGMANWRMSLAADTLNIMNAKAKLADDEARFMKKRKWLDAQIKKGKTEINSRSKGW